MYQSNSMCLPFAASPPALPLWGGESQMAEVLSQTHQHVLSFCLLQPQLAPSFLPTLISGSPRAGRVGAPTTRSLPFTQRQASEIRQPHTFDSSAQMLRQSPVMFYYEASTAEMQ